MVEMNVVLNVSSENLNRMHVLPTPESPISSNLNSRSYLLAILSGSEFGGDWKKKTKTPNGQMTSAPHEPARPSLMSYLLAKFAVQAAD